VTSVINDCIEDVSLKESAALFNGDDTSVNRASGKHFRNLSRVGGAVPSA
jgi:hypothetical protein